MKNLFKYFIPCLFIAVGLTSCYDTMDDKRDIDAQHESAFSTPVIVSATATATHNTATITASVENKDNVAEQGIQFSETQSFTTDDYIASEIVENTYTVEVSKLKELTTYYYRAYAVGKNGAVVYGNTQSVTTAEAPLTPLAGAYTAVDYEYDNGQFVAGDPYPVTVAFETGSTDIVNIYNLWYGDETIQGKYDVETQTITVPSLQLIYNDPDYGPCAFIGLDNTGSPITEATFAFNPHGGEIETSLWRVRLTSGPYAGYWYGKITYTVMQHDN